MTTRCPICNANLALVGRIHRCIPSSPYSSRGQATVTENTPPVTKNNPRVTENPKRRGRPPSPSPLSQAERAKRYRTRQKNKSSEQIMDDALKIYPNALKNLAQK